MARAMAISTPSPLGAATGAAVFVIALIAGGTAGLTYFLAGTVAAVAVAAGILLIGFTILLYFSAVLFQRFDVSVDMPA